MLSFFRACTFSRMSAMVRVLALLLWDGGNFIGNWVDHIREARWLLFRLIVLRDEELGLDGPSLLLGKLVEITNSFISSCS